MIEELIKQFGFPIAVAVYFIWDNRRIQKEHLDDVKTVTSQAVDALNRNTESDKAVTDQLAKNNTALSDTNQILSRVEGVLSVRERDNGTGGA